jgi:hypothetical protein
MGKFCPACGAAVTGGDRFCGVCGATITESGAAIQQSDSKKDVIPEQTHNDGNGTLPRPSPNILLGQDGKLRWLYELNLYKNPTILMMIWKIFFFIFVGMFVLLMLVQAGDGLADAFRGLAPVFLGMILGMGLLSTVTYYVYALLMGGKYCVVFEMDEKGVKHTQMPKQFKRGQAIGLITALAGAATGNLTAIGTGILAGTKNETYSKFKQVTSVKGSPKRGVIKVNSKDMVHNQVYAEAADFDFVLNYIHEHVRQAKTTGKK